MQTSTLCLSKGLEGLRRTEGENVSYRKAILDILVHL